MTNCSSYCDKCGNCSRCGECCAAMLPLTRKEEKRIREYIKKNNIEPEFFQKDNSINLQCCFYDRTNKICKIYEVRPLICKTFKCNKDEDIIEREKWDAHERAYWNNMKPEGSRNITDMRLLFYDDPRSLVGNMIRSVTNGTMECTKEHFEFVKKYLKCNGQEEVANRMEADFSQ